MIAQIRKGRLDLYKGLSFMRFSDEKNNADLNVTNNTYSSDCPKIELEKVPPQTDRTLIRFHEKNNSSVLMFEEEKRGSNSESKEYSTFDDQETNQIYYGELVCNTMIKSTKGYGFDHELSAKNNGSTRASTIYKASPL